ncbi:MAG: hypothetical protein HYW48_04530 [Deltaproteobacteria bacterium]|nr:hypothetical protein [Deltaproteobacteria bacterium]
MEETAQLVPPRNALGERPFALLRAGFSLAPPNPPLPICPKWLTHYGQSSTVTLQLIFL